MLEMKYVLHITNICTCYLYLALFQTKNLARSWKFVHLKSQFSTNDRFNAFAMYMFLACKVFSSSAQGTDAFVRRASARLGEGTTCGM